MLWFDNNQTVDGQYHLMNNEGNESVRNNTHFFSMLLKSTTSTHAAIVLSPAIGMSPVLIASECRYYIAIILLCSYNADQPADVVADAGVHRASDLNLLQYIPAFDLFAHAVLVCADGRQ